MQIKRDDLEEVVMNKPALLQDLGRLIDERQSKVRQATRRNRKGAQVINSGPPHMTV